MSKNDPLVMCPRCGSLCDCDGRIDGMLSFTCMSPGCREQFTTLPANNDDGSVQVVDPSEMIVTLSRGYRDDM